MTFAVYLNQNFKYEAETYKEAYDWAENKYGSRQDGIYVDGVEIIENAKLHTK
jgi:hypothetical protein